MISTIDVFVSNPLTKEDFIVINTIKKWKRNHKNVRVLIIKKHNFNKTTLKLYCDNDVHTLSIDSDIKLEKILNKYFYGFGLKGFFCKLFNLY